MLLRASVGVQCAYTYVTSYLVVISPLIRIFGVKLKDGRQTDGPETASHL